MAGLIGSVSLTPLRPRPGESVHVQVLDSKGHPYTAQSGERVSIDGIAGATRTLQFPTVGERSIQVQVFKGRASQTLIQPISVIGNPIMIERPGGPGKPILRQIAMLWADWSYGQPYDVTFSVGAAPLTPTEARLKGFAQSGAVMSPPTPAKVLAGLKAGTPGVGKVAAALASLPGVQVEQVSTTALLGPAVGRSITSVVLNTNDIDPSSVSGFVSNRQLTSYSWEFGDGTSATTAGPQVSHDYSKSLVYDQETQAFQVVCHLPNGTSVARTLTIHSTYAISRSLGYIVLPAKFNMLAYRSWMPVGNGGRFGVMVAVSNPEPQAVTLRQRALVAESDDSSGSEARVPVFRTLATPITIPAGKTASIGVLAPIAENSDSDHVSWDATGFTVYFAGTADDGKLVRMTIPCEIPYDLRGPGSTDDKGPQVPTLASDPWPWQILTPGVTQTFTDPENPLNVLVDPATLIVDPETGVWAVITSVDATGVAVPTAVGAIAARIMSIALNPVSGTGIADALAGKVTSVENLALARLAVATKAGLQSTPVAARRRLAPVPPPAPGQPPTPAPPGPPQIGPVAAGQVCDPLNIPDADAATADAAQLVCQATDNTASYTIDARFSNARKGDIILSPGGIGLIAGLLRQVNPPQRWSHTGIMTRNLDEITHSTMSQARLMDHKVGYKGSNGLELGPLLYGWPGAITQTVNHAVTGEPWKEPATGKVYPISPFTPHPEGGSTTSGDFDIVPPMVVKPDPFKETSDLRTTLHGIADEAAGLGARVDSKGNIIKAYGSYYSFYAYTDPTIGLTPDTINKFYWTFNTIPTVCSAMIWICAKRRGVHLETTGQVPVGSDLEPKDIQSGATLLPTGRDGLYSYTAVERQDAANWLFNEVHNQAKDLEGWFGDIVFGAADIYGNQVCNAFANNSGSADSDAWRQTGDASAVSPDNILFWDSPDTGGVYGYAETAIYREPRVEQYTVSEWTKVLSRGDIMGTVSLNGNVVMGARVEVYDGKDAVTALDGTYSIKDVPFGVYLLHAEWLSTDGILYSGQRQINTSTAAFTADLTLSPPPDRYRLLKCLCTFHGNDDEFIGHESDDEGFYQELELGPDKLENSFSPDAFHWGGELSCQWTITGDLLADDSVLITIYGELWEGTGETRDQEHFAGSKTTHAIIPKEGTLPIVLYVSNTTNDTPDSGTLSVVATNARNIV